MLNTQRADAALKDPGAAARPVRLRRRPHGSESFTRNRSRSFGPRSYSAVSIPTIDPGKRAALQMEGEKQPKA